jgi:hypothetical protein
LGGNFSPPPTSTGTAFAFLASALTYTAPHPLSAHVTAQVDGAGLTRFVERCCTFEVLDLASVPGINDIAVKALVKAVKRMWPSAKKFSEVGYGASLVDTYSSSPLGVQPWNDV